MKDLLIFRVDVCCSLPKSERQALQSGPVRTVDLASSRKASGINASIGPQDFDSYVYSGNILNHSARCI